MAASKRSRHPDFSPTPAPVQGSLAADCLRVIRESGTEGRSMVELQQRFRGRYRRLRDLRGVLEHLKETGCVSLTIERYPGYRRKVFHVLDMAPQWEPLRQPPRGTRFALPELPRPSFSPAILRMPGTPDLWIAFVNGEIYGNFDDAATASDFVRARRLD